MRVFVWRARKKSGPSTMLTTFPSTVKTVKVTMQFLSAARLYRFGWTFLVEILFASILKFRLMQQLP